MPDTHYTNLPLATIQRKAEALIASGATIYQKWTCDGCGERLTTSKPNTLYSRAQCEHCGTITDIAAKGCGFLLVASLVPPE